MLRFWKPIVFFYFRQRRPEMQDIGYNPESAMLKAYTTAKRAEIGILYLGMRLRNTIWRKNLSMSHSSVPTAIYYFEKEKSYTIDNGWISLKIKPFYGGFLSRNIRGYMLHENDFAVLATPARMRS